MKVEPYKHIHLWQLVSISFLWVVGTQMINSNYKKIVDWNNEKLRILNLLPQCVKNTYLKAMKLINGCFDVWSFPIDQIVFENHTSP